MKLTTINKNERGVVLVLTLFVLVMLGTIALDFSLNTMAGSATVRNFKESTQARTMAISAVENTMAYLMSDPDPIIDYLDEDGILRTDAERPPVSGVFDTDEGTVEIILTDEDSKLNIRALNHATLSVLMPLVENSGQNTDDLIAALMDWTDLDDLHRINGAESDYYNPLGYDAKNLPLDIPGELELIRGFENSTAMDRLGSVITTFSDKININTASPLVLEAMGLDSLGVSSLTEMRASMKGLRNIPTNITQPGATSSNVFRIDVRASLQGSPEIIHITSIVRRQEDMRFKTIYWREAIEAGGA